MKILMQNNINNMKLKNKNFLNKNNLNLSNLNNKYKNNFKKKEKDYNSYKDCKRLKLLIKY